MNWDAVLTTLWNKISKPVTNILIGSAFLFFAPEGVNWFGWVFLALGIGGFIDNNSWKISQAWKKFQKENKIKDELRHLTASEEAILKLMVRHNKQILRQNEFLNFLNADSQHAQNLPRQIFDVFSSLDDKQILTYYPNSRDFSLEVKDFMWQAIKKRYKKEFNIAYKNEEKP